MDQEIPVGAHLRAWLALDSHYSRGKKKRRSARYSVLLLLLLIDCCVAGAAEASLLVMGLLLVLSAAVAVAVWSASSWRASSDERLWPTRSQRSDRVVGELLLAFHAGISPVTVQSGRFQAVDAAAKQTLRLWNRVLAFEESGTASDRELAHRAFRAADEAMVGMILDWSVKAMAAGEIQQLVDEMSKTADRLEGVALPTEPLDTTRGLLQTVQEELDGIAVAKDELEQASRPIVS